MAIRQAANRKVKVSVDPRIELASVIQLYAPFVDLSESAKYHYMNEVVNAFIKWKGHEAVRAFTELFYKGFSYDALVGLMVRLSNPPELKITAEFSKYVIEKAGGEGRLLYLINAFRKFALESNFTDFYITHMGFYERIIANSNLKGRASQAVEALEGFFQEKMWGYRVILTPLLKGNYGHSLRRGERVTAFAFICPSKIVNGLPIFEDVTVAVEHELAHAFVNPLTEEHRNVIDRYFKAREDVNKQLAEIGYSRWESVINEHVIRACITLIEARQRGLSEGDIVEWLNAEERLGFKYIKAFYSTLKKYVNGRKYRSFRDFYPEIIKTLKGIV